MQLFKCLIIYNPVSGTKTAENYLRQLIRKVSEKGGLSLCYATQNEEDAFNIANKEGPNVDTIIAIGGDGTISKVAAGLIKSGAKTPLAFIPAGTSNDFAVGLGLSEMSESELIDLAINYPARPFDMGLINDRPFIYVAAFGAFSSVSYRTPQLSKNALGKAAYFIEGLKDLPNLSDYRLIIENGDQVIKGDYIFGMVSNSNVVAGIVNMDAPTNYHDGLFEVLFIKSGFSPIDYAAAANDLRNGKFDHPAILMFQSSSFTLKSDKKLSWTIDGEEGGSFKETRIKVLNNIISFRIADGKKL